MNPPGVHGDWRDPGKMWDRMKCFLSALTARVHQQLSRRNNGAAPRGRLTFIWVTVALSIFSGLDPLAAQSSTPASQGQTTASEATAGQSGESDPPTPEESSPAESSSKGQLGGPGSVHEQTRQNREQRTDVLKKFGDRLKTDYGLSLGADYNVLPQVASNSPGENAAASGVFRIYGHWKPFNRTAPGSGSLVFKVEHRHLLGTEISPQALGPAVGVAGITAVAWSDAGGILSNLHWIQAFADNRFAFTAGIVDVTDYVDVFGLGNLWTDFSNQAFNTNPIIPAPGQGLGAAASWMFTPNLYVLGGAADANGDPHDPTHSFSSLGDGELFKHFEVGWIRSFENRFADNIHITFWQVDDRVEADVEGSWGTALSLSHTVGQRWLPFVRGGFADGGGAIVDRSVSAGVGCLLNERRDYFGIGLNWGRPPREAAGENPRNQYTIETYYRAQVVPHLLVVPSAQFVIDPALDRTKDSLWILGIKLRVTF